MVGFMDVVVSDGPQRPMSSQAGALINTLSLQLYYTLVTATFAMARRCYSLGRECGVSRCVNDSLRWQGLFFFSWVLRGIG